MVYRITESGMVKALDAVALLGAGGAEACNGSIATWGSRVYYAPFVEYIWRRGSGGARMFERGVAMTLPMVAPLLLDAIPRGPAAVGAAKRKIRDAGTENIKAITPVRTGRLQSSVQEMSRPGSPLSPPLNRSGRVLFQRG